MVKMIVNNLARRFRSLEHRRSQMTVRPLSLLYLTIDTSMPFNDWAVDKKTRLKVRVSERISLLIYIHLLSQYCRFFNF